MAAGGLELVAFCPGFLEQADVLARDRRMIGQCGQELDLLLYEGMRLEEVVDENAEDLPAAQDGHGHIGAWSLGLDQGVGSRRVLQRWIGQTVCRPDGAPLLKCPTG